MKLQRNTNISDRTLLMIYNFFLAFLTLVADIFHVETIRQFLCSIPRTLYSMRKLINLERNDFLEYAVCPKCHFIYPLNDVINSRVERCQYVRWPRHTQQALRRPCNTQLLKGSTRTPKRIFSFRPISDYLKAFVS